MKKITASSDPRQSLPTESRTARFHCNAPAPITPPRRSPLFVALIAALGVGPYALAQEGPAEQADETTAEEEAADGDEEDEEAMLLNRVAVTGYRQAVQRSVETRRIQSSITESVFAEEIGKLPDVSISEALARLPGLTSQRVDGRSQTIDIRGLGPDFSTALLNGREQVTTGDNRGIEFDQFPAELLNSVVVYKTPDPSLIGQGLAGTVDLRTIRPLQADRQIASVVGRYEFLDSSASSPEAEDKGYRFSGIYVDQFADNTFGMTLGATVQSTPFQIEQSNAWGFPSIDPDNDGPVVLGGAKPFVASTELERIGLLGTFEYAPTANFSAILDLSYSDFKETQFLRGIEFPLFWSDAQLQDGFTTENGLVTEGVFENVHPVARNDFNQRDAELFTFGLNTRWDFASLWGFETDWSFSVAEREDVRLESLGGTSFSQSGLPTTVAFELDEDGLYRLSPDVDFTDPNLVVLTDPQGWGAGAQPNPLTQAGFVNNPDTTDWLGRIRFDLDRTFVSGPIRQVKAGVAFSRRDKERDFFQAFLTLPNDGTEAPIPDEALLDGSVGLGFIGVPGVVAWNSRYLLNNFYVPVEPQVEFRKQQEWRVREDVINSYVQLDIDTLLGGSVPLRGNIGVQWVVTDQTSAGFQVQAGVAEDFQEVENGDTFNRFLPSMNLTLELPHQQQLRFAASRVMARPRMDQMNAGRALNRNFNQLESTNPLQGFFSASGGNPRLKPTMATGVDLAYEKYFGNGEGLFTISAFYKDLEDYINPDRTFIADFAQFIPLVLSPEQAEDLGTPLGLVSGPDNAGDGWIRGVDMAATIPFGLVHPMLEGFGYTGGVSYNDSKINLDGVDGDTTIPGLSEWTVSSTLFYERGGFQARVSHRYRDEFLSELFGVAANRIQRSAKSESIWDAQIGYEFKTGSLEGLTLTLQALNLTDEPFVTFDQNGFTIDRQEFGRNFLFGASYRF